MIRPIQAALFICIPLLSNPLLAKQATLSPERVKQLALQQCILNNYRAISGDNPAYQYDVSYYVEKVTFDRDGTGRRPAAFRSFVKKNTENFHVNDTSMAMKEGPRPYNTAFAKCMDFYQSNNLNRFVKEFLKSK
jgi:hypothetical protein